MKSLKAWTGLICVCGGWGEGVGSLVGLCPLLKSHTTFDFFSSTGSLLQNVTMLTEGIRRVALLPEPSCRASYHG